MMRLLIVIAIVASGLSAYFSWKVFGAMPHIPDELAYLYQARLFASGRIWIEPPEVPEAFRVRWDHILRDQKHWRGLYPPGWPLLLVPGWWIRAPWLINPLLLSLTTIGVYKLAGKLFDAKTALVSVIVFVLSPFVLMMSAGLMSHPAALCMAVWCLFSATERRFATAGLLGAFTFIIRPYTGATLLVPTFLWAILNSDKKWEAVLRIAKGAAPIVFLFFAYNTIIFGSAFRTGYSYDPDASFKGSLWECFRQNIPWYFSNLNRFLWGGGWPNLLIFVPLLIPHKKWKLDLLLASGFFTLLIGYAVFYYHDITYSGPRYLYESVGFLAILAARSVILIDDLIKTRIKIHVAAIVLLLLFYSLVASVPKEMEYHSKNYHGQSKELLDLVRKKVGKNALMLIGGDPFVFRTFFLENSLRPRDSERVFARDLPGKRAEIMRAYPRKEVWTYHILLRMIPGRNKYEDQAEIESIRLERVENPPRRALEFRGL
jgi:Dolichyl-phosphate-mannose-protein mannosyltransferase